MHSSAAAATTGFLKATTLTITFESLQCMISRNSIPSGSKSGITISLGGSNNYVVDFSRRGPHCSAGLTIWSVQLIV